MDVRLGGADEGHLPHVGVEAELPAGRELEGLLDAHLREGGQGESEGGGSGQRPESVGMHGSSSPCIPVRRPLGEVPDS